MPVPPPQSAPRALRILFFVPMCVYPISHGGASRIMNTIWGLSKRGHDVHVLSLVATEDERRAMMTIPNVASSHSHVLPLERRYLPGTDVPTVVRNTYRPSAGRLIVDMLRRHSIDVLELEYTDSAAYIKHSLGVPTVLVEHDIAYRSAVRSALKQDGALQVSRKLFDAARLYRWELKHAERADLVLTASELEAEILRRHGIARASAAVPNGVDVATFEPRGPRNESRDVLFVGYYLHPPNVDGLRYFISEICPLLRAKRQELSVTVVGSNLPADLADAAEACGCRYAGFVEDVRAELWSHRVFVCPIRYGAGTRIKLLEAAAAKCAIVSTSLGAEGLGLRDERDLLLADTPAAFAAAVCRLLDDESLRVRLGNSAHAAVTRRFDWPMLAGNLEAAYYELLARA